MITHHKTPEAARSLITLIRGSSWGWIKSDIFSMTVFHISACTTNPIANSSATHSPGVTENNTARMMTPIDARRWMNAWVSVLKTEIRPDQATPMLLFRWRRNFLIVADLIFSPNPNFLIGTVFDFFELDTIQEIIVVNVIYRCIKQRFLVVGQGREK